MAFKNILFLLALALVLTYDRLHTEGATRLTSTIGTRANRKSSEDDYDKTASCSLPGFPKPGSEIQSNLCFATDLIHQSQNKDSTTYYIQLSSEGEEMQFSLCALSSVQAKARKSSSTVAKPPTAAVGCRVHSDNPEGSWFLDVSGVAVCDVVCFYTIGYWERPEDLPSRLPMVPLVNDFNTFEVSAQDTTSNGGSVFVTERDSADKETRVCGLTSMQTTVNLQSKENKFSSGYCKLSADEMKYDLVANPGSRSTSCASTCTTALSTVLTSSPDTTKGVYITDKVHQSIEQFGRLDTDTNKKSFQTCFLSYVSIQSSSGYSGSRGCRVSLDQISTDAVEGNETYAWSLKVIGPPHGDAVTCGALCVCRVLYDKKSGQPVDQPWCIPPMGLGHQSTRQGFHLGQRQKSIDQATPGGSQTYHELLKDPAVIVLIAVFFGLLYIGIRRMKFTTAKIKQKKQRRPEHDV